MNATGGVSFSDEKSVQLGGISYKTVNNSKYSSFYDLMVVSNLTNVFRDRVTLIASYFISTES